MKKKTAKSLKLTLNRETLRTLQTTTLADAAGASTRLCTDTCPTDCLRATCGTKC